ncbi:related to glutaredoxin [Phialocephala subalpina]|uniref:Related to glutaredoxin n=1 Tax=Phialocephala subalpina TaxID=576137 RepID=A0A1L7X788_9HELO|nr:related to glutaredoxin [Phialocephala subalpina]
MASMRRIKTIFLLIFIFALTILFYTNSARSSQNPDLRTASDFYSKTKIALDNQNNPKKPGTPGAKDSIIGTGNEKGDGGEFGGDEESKAMQQRLKEAADSAKEKANAKAPKPDPPSAVVGKGSAAEGASGERSVAGRKKFGVVGGEVQEPIKEESEEEHNAEVELNLILKKSPIIIFSKSYCPHSKRAKDILLGKYIIDPAPYVVELDQHKQGPQLQALLAEKTGRKTVPNVLINGVSIGGGDDVAELHESKTLIDKINEFGGKKILEVKAKPVEPSEDHGLR